jgi:predicted NBD/HSP70 family sugar kinase
MARSPAARRQQATGEATGSGSSRAETGSQPSLEWAQNSTASTVIDLIRRNDGISRTELARRLGLSAQGMSKVVARLLEAGMVMETGRVSVGVGKARTRLSLVTRSRFALGVHLDRSGFSMVLVNLAGQTEAAASDQFRTPPSPADAVEMLGVAADTLLAGLGEEQYRVIGCGLGMAGPLDHRRGVVTTPNNFFGWREVPLASLVAQRIHTPVKLDKSTNMATIAENSRSHRPGWTVVIYVGTGIGAGLMLDGAVYRGVHSDAGEFGHMVLDPTGPECVCGRRGCVEVLSSPASVVDRYFRQVDAALSGDQVPAWGRDTSRQLRKIVRLADNGDTSANHALAESGRLLGIAAGNLVTLLDVEDVIIAGPMLDLVGPTYVDGVMHGMDATLAGSNRLLRTTVSDLRADTIALGGALLIFGSL